MEGAGTVAYFALDAFKLPGTYNTFKSVLMAFN